jgi:hypothetical protein
MLGSSAYHRKLSRPARHLARHLLRHKGWHRATELRAAAGALHYEVRSPTEPGVETPADPGDQLVQRVRIGPETRGLLKRLLAARNIHVQRALVREIRKSIADRIALHIRRSKALAAVRSRSARAARWSVRMAQAAPGAARSAPRRTMSVWDSAVTRSGRQGRKAPVPRGRAVPLTTTAAAASSARPRRRRLGRPRIVRTR